MSTSRVILVIAGVLLLLLAAFTYRYLALHGMKPSPSYERGQPSTSPHVLIATQGSLFKDRLVAGLVAQLETRPAYVKVIDISGLSGIQDADWQVIVIVHTWEYGKPPGAVSGFVKRVASPGNVIDVTTSGSGREKLPGVDVISSASVVDDVPELLTQIGRKVDALLSRT